MKKKFIVSLLVIGIHTLSFAQDTTAQQTTQAHVGVAFNLPTGSWQPVPEGQSLVPYLDNKIQEQIETDKKITVVYQTTGAYADIRSLFSNIDSAFGRHWGKVETVDSIQLISPKTAIGGPRKFNAVYKILDKLSETAFRVEVVVVSGFDFLGNKGILYIITPEYNYYENRFTIAELKNALTLDPEAVKTEKSQNPA